MDRQLGHGPPFGRLATVVVAQLEEQVRHRLGGRVRDFRRSIRDTGLVLEGRTASRCARQLAQHADMDLTWVQIQANEIEVC
jgi:hypothetical protein